MESEHAGLVAAKEKRVSPQTLQTIALSLSGAKIESRNHPRGPNVKRPSRTPIVTVMRRGTESAPAAGPLAPSPYPGPSPAVQVPPRVGPSVGLGGGRVRGERDDHQREHGLGRLSCPCDRRLERRVEGLDGRWLFPNDHQHGPQPLRARRGQMPCAAPRGPCPRRCANGGR